MFDKSRKGVAATTIFLVVASVLGLGFFAFSSGNILELFNLVLNNIVYLVIEILIVLFGFGLITMVRQDDISNDTAIQAGIGLLFMAIAIPIIGSQVIGATSTYTANIAVNTEEGYVGFQDFRYNGLTVESVDQDGPEILSINQACLVGCDDYKVEITVTCENEVVREVSVSGNAGDEKVRSIGGLPAGKQCTARGDLVEPITDGKLTDTVSFYTG